MTNDALKFCPGCQRWRPAREFSSPSDACKCRRCRERRYAGEPKIATPKPQTVLKSPGQHDRDK